MGPSGVSFACHALAYAFAITTANFNEIEDKHQKYGVPKGSARCIEPNGNLYSDPYQLLSSMLLNVYIINVRAQINT